jgi:chorismate mutase/prephenate dehydratase
VAESQRSAPAAAGPAPVRAAAELGALRGRIDEVDEEILSLLNRRARLVEQVGALKRASGSAVYESSREREIVTRLARANPGPFPEAGLAPVFREIISATRSLEERLKVAYLGPAGTFTHAAAREQFGAQAELVGLASIEDVFAAVERGKAALGVVPVENTTEGIVTQTYDALVRFEAALCGEVLQRIHHQLLSRARSLAEVRRVVSHPQPLAQCRGWLDRNLPAAERCEAASTAAAALAATQDPCVAAIGSAIAAEAYGLAVLESSIEDRSDNTTRFLLIGRHAPAPTGNDLTSALFTIRKDEAGGLYRLLEPFATRGVNLTSLQLRPIAGKPWEYVFFLDLEGHYEEERVRSALEAAASLAHSHRVLGSYPRAARPVAPRSGAPGAGRG